MNSARLLRALNSPLAGLLIGAGFFFSVFGPRILDPTYIDWQLGGDPGQHYLGWAFFRQEPWHFPIGRIAGYGTPDGSSVFYSDSIPLLAVFFKLIRGLLPEPFQYTGWWILACYLLQGFYGWRLSSLTTAQPYPRVLMTCLFVVSPTLLNRSGDHHALMAHWLLLAGIYLSVQTEHAFNQRHRGPSWLTRWIALLCLSAVIHLYVWLMVAILYAGAIVANIWRGTLRGSKLAFALGLPALLLPALLYLEGAFVVKSSSWTTGFSFGHFSMNLLAPLVPGYWSTPEESRYASYFLSPQGVATGGQYEGFNYVGLGAILLFVITSTNGFVYAVRYRQGAGVIGLLRGFKPSVAWPVLVSALVIAFLATSNIVTLGRGTLFTVPLPKPLLQFGAIFRSSGRFFWLPSYLILWMICHAYGRQLYRRPFVCLTALQALVAVQVIDLSQFFKHFSQPYEKAAHYSSPLRSKFWNSAMRKYKDVLYYPPSDWSYYIPLGLVAAPAGAGINVAYKAREDTSIVSQARHRLESELRSGNLRVGALYVFRDKNLFETLKQKPTAGEHLLEEVDGFYVAARR